MRRIVPRQALLAGATLAAFIITGKDAAAQGRACAELASMARADLRITKAESVPAGVQPTENRGRAALAGEGRAAMPAHCLVQGLIAPRTGVNGVAYGIGFEIRMPEG